MSSPCGLVVCHATNLFGTEQAGVRSPPPVEYMLDWLARAYGVAAPELPPHSLVPDRPSSVLPQSVGNITNATMLCPAGSASPGVGACVGLDATAPYAMGWPFEAAGSSVYLPQFSALTSRLKPLSEHGDAGADLHGGEVHFDAVGRRRVVTRCPCFPHCHMHMQASVQAHQTAVLCAVPTIACASPACGSDLGGTLVKIFLPPPGLPQGCSLSPILGPSGRVPLWCEFGDHSVPAQVLSDDASGALVSCVAPPLAPRPVDASPEALNTTVPLWLSFAAGSANTTAGATVGTHRLPLTRVSAVRNSGGNVDLVTSQLMFTYDTVAGGDEVECGCGADSRSAVCGVCGTPACVVVAPPTCADTRLSQAFARPRRSHRLLIVYRIALGRVSVWLGWTTAKCALVAKLVRESCRRGGFVPSDESHRSRRSPQR